MEPAYVLVIDGAAKKALRSMCTRVGERTKVRVRNSAAPHDIAAVDAWWSVDERSLQFNYMDGLSEHAVHFGPEYADMLLARSEV